MSKKPSRKLRSRLGDLFTAIPEADPVGDANGGRPGASTGVPGGWLWESDLDGRYTWCSPEIERFLGWEPRSLLGKEVAGIGLTPESGDKIRPLMASGAAADGLRLEARGGDGSHITLLFSAQIRPGLNGKPAGYRGAVQVLSVTPGAPVEEELPAPAGDIQPQVGESGADVSAATAPRVDLTAEEPPAAITPEVPLTPLEVGGPGAQAEPTTVIAKDETPAPPEVRSQELSTAESASAARASTPPAEPGARARPTGPLSQRPTGPLSKRQTGSLRKRQTGQLAVSGAVAPQDVNPMEPPPLLPTWGPSTAYVDTVAGLQPIPTGAGAIITEPRIDGSRLLVPIRVKDEVLGVLTFDENEAGRAWNDDDIAMAVAISEQLAVALQDARSVQLTETALEEMREADRLKTQFLANMSHELRTPLNSIIGFSRVILKGIDGPVNETQETDLQAIHNAGLHLLGLINDILDLSKIEAGKMELTFGDVDLREIVRGVMSTAAGLVKDKPIELAAEVPEDLGVLQADSIRVRQVLLNLVSNAAKFTDQGRIDVVVTRLDDVDPGEILVSVSDTGPGIAPEDQAKLFEPFSQVDASPTRKTGGTGLGLSICRHLVELHGGTIWVDSQPGRGSTFFFTLPVRQPEAFDEAAPAAEGPVILVIDANADVAARYRDLFEGLGYHFESLERSDGAPALARQRPPDLVIVDPMLPGHSGWATVAELRKLDGLRGAPILMGGLNRQNGSGYRIHATDVRMRPTEPQELLAAIHRLAPNGGRPLDVLLVEDDEGEAAAIRQAVDSDADLGLRLAANSTEAYHATRKQTPDVVVLNLTMARAEGFRALEIVRKDPRLRSTPVLALISPEPHPEERRQMTLYTEYIHRQGTSSQDEYLAELAGLAQTLLARR